MLCVACIAKYLARLSATQWPAMVRSICSLGDLKTSTFSPGSSGESLGTSNIIPSCPHPCKEKRRAAQTSQANNKFDLRLLMTNKTLITSSSKPQQEANFGSCLSMFGLWSKLCLIRFWVLSEFFRIPIPRNLSSSTTTTSA